MFKGIIKLLIVFLVFVFAVSGMQTAFAESYDKYGIIIDDNLSLKNTYISIVEGISYLPINQIQKEIGITSIVKNADGSGSISFGKNVYRFDAKGNIGMDGKGSTLPYKFIISDSVLYIPVFFMTDVLKYKVDILDEISCVRITTRENALPSVKVIDRYKLLNIKDTTGDNIKHAYLTFDDGLDRKVTTEILDILKGYNLKATFFIVGNTIDRNKDILVRMAAEGHSIGNHTYTHKREIIYKNINSFSAEVKKTDEKIAQVCGKSSILFRPPYGMPYIKSAEYRNALADHRIIPWNVDSMDSRSKDIKAEQILANVIYQTKNKKSAVILFHNSGTHEETAKALPKVIEYLLDNGFVISNINEDTPVSFKY